MWRFDFNIEFGRIPDDPQPDREGSADALTELSYDPGRPPIGFCPPSDPTRRPDPHAHQEA